AGLTHHNKKTVYQKTLKSYPLVLSDKYARAAIKYAGDALLRIGDGPRWRGFVNGTALSAALSALYFVTPLRALILDAMGRHGAAHHMLLPDIAVWAAGYVATWLIIKLAAAQALARLLP